MNRGKTISLPQGGLERLQAKFLKKVRKTKGCWWWTAGESSGGYGSLSFGGKPQKAHRVSFTLFKGPIENGLLVCHSCDNKLCVNPEHLWLGTDKDNTMDSIKKGRHKNQNYKHLIRRFSEAGWKASSEKFKKMRFCKRGHEFTKENTWVSKIGGRNCKACAKMNHRLWWIEKCRRRKEGLNS